MQWLKKLFSAIGKFLSAAFTQKVLERVVAGVCIAALLAMCGVIKPF
jgi:hypothetical protein